MQVGQPRDQRVMEPFPFVVGCGRSGTTLLRAMLDSHPDVAVPPESYFVVSMVRERPRYLRGRRFPVRRFAADLCSRRRFQRWGLSIDEVAAELSAKPPASYADAVRSVFGLFASKQGKSRYGDKTPTYVLQMPLIADVLPEARFVHVVRDGRDVALSLLEVGFGPQSVGEAALYWRRHVAAGRGAGEALGPQRYREVRYERLVEEPDAVLEELAAFLEIGFDPRMLRYFERASEMVVDLRPENHRNVEHPPTRFRDWRTQMASDDVVLFESLAGDLLGELGYERVASGRSQVSAAVLARHERPTLRRRLALKGRSLMAAPVRALRWRLLWLRTPVLRSDG